MSTVQLTFGSLFAGIGGFDLGLERAGLHCEWQVEIDDFATRVLKKHWPDVQRGRDVRHWPEAGTKSVDVVAAGFPCKQTSVGAAIHGRRTGLAGKDSGLFHELVRVLPLVGARALVMENVAGAKSYQAEIKRCLASVGYIIDEQPFRLSAEDLGAPHRRWRLFWFAHRDEPGLQIARLTESFEAFRQARRTFNRDAWLPTLPRGLRVDDGVPGRVDRRQRIIACGNAFMPQKAEMIGQWLKTVM